MQEGEKREKKNGEQERARERERRETRKVICLGTLYLACEQGRLKKRLGLKVAWQEIKEVERQK